MVSIIIPIFNVERCLSVCIDSIRRQTDQNFEVIALMIHRPIDLAKFCRFMRRLIPALR